MATLTAIPPASGFRQRPYLDLWQRRQAVVLRARAARLAGQQSPRLPALAEQPASERRAAGAHQALCGGWPWIAEKNGFAPVHQDHSISSAFPPSSPGSCGIGQLRELGRPKRGGNGSGRRIGVGVPVTWRGEPARPGRVGGLMRHEEAPRPAGCAEGSFHPDNLSSGCSAGTASHPIRSARAVGSGGNQ